MLSCKLTRFVISIIYNKLSLTSSSQVKNYIYQSSGQSMNYQNLIRIQSFSTGTESAARKLLPTGTLFS